MGSDELDDDGARASVREILSANVRRLIDDAKESRPHLGSILKVSVASKKITHGSSTLSKSRVGRIVTGSHPTDIDALTDLAEVFGLQPWQLLVANLNPKALPQLVDAALVSQLKQIILAANAQTEEISPSLADEHPVQEATPTGNIKTGRALQDSFEPLGKKKNERRGTASPPKPKGGRSR